MEMSFKTGLILLVIIIVGSYFGVLMADMKMHNKLKSEADDEMYKEFREFMALQNNE